RRGAAATEGGTQTGHRGGVSNTGLVLDLDRAQRGEQLLDEVVLLGVQRRAAQEGEAAGAVELVAVVVLVLPGGDHAVGDHVGRLLHGQPLPLGAVGAAVLDAQLAPGAVDVLLGGGALGAQAPAGDRAVRVALDLDDLLV